MSTLNGTAKRAQPYLILKPFVPPFAIWFPLETHPLFVLVFLPSHPKTSFNEKGMLSNGQCRCKTFSFARSSFHTQNYCRHVLLMVDAPPSPSLKMAQITHRQQNYLPGEYLKRVDGGDFSPINHRCFRRSVRFNEASCPPH